MLAAIGTIPDDRVPVLEGAVRLTGDCIRVDSREFPVNRGTPALLAAVLRTGEVLGLPPPVACLAGDTGRGHGSRRLYEHLVGHVHDLGASTLVFHYLQPDVDWHNKVLFAVEDLHPQPALIADAGFMYAAKMSGQAGSYELFTPDAGELAFLSDEEAPHPFYTRGFILHEDRRVPDLIREAYRHGNAARVLLVKGQPDHVASGAGIHAVVDHPSEGAMEAMGGTGDSLTGVVSALVASGMETLKACVLGARINRLAGHLARPTPASQVMEMIEHIPAAVSRILREEEQAHAPRQAL